MREQLFLLLLLAWPLAMLLMMRGGLGHGGHSHRRNAQIGSGQDAMAAGRTVFGDVLKEE